MKFPITTAMRRAAKLTRAGKPVSATSAMQKAIGAAMIKPALTSMGAMANLTTGAPKTAKKPRKAAVQKPRAQTTPRVSARDRRLGTVLKHLQTARAWMPRRLSASGAIHTSEPPAVPQGAQYLQRAHTCTAGSRDFTLYLPTKQSVPPKGLIVMLHGCTQTPDDFARGTNMNAVAQKHGLAVAYPAQTDSHNARSCWNWFTPTSQARGAGEPAILASLAGELMQEFGLDRTQVFVAGLSAGGAMAEILVNSYPDVFSAAGVHSGLPRGAATSVMSALSAMRSGGETVKASRRKKKSPSDKDESVRRIIFHGDDDATVHPSNAAQIAIGAVGARKPVQFSPKTAAGRAYTRSEYRAPDGSVDVELWQIKGAGHAWSGGKTSGSFTDPAGPNASAEMVRFFLAKDA